MSRNPVKQARVSRGLTLAQASDQAGCHLQAFFLTEQGVYPEILPAVRDWLVDQGVDMETVPTDYREFQRQKRVANGQIFTLNRYVVGEPTEKNAVVAFRLSLPLSRLGFAKGFCVHPGLLYRVESGISRALPAQLADALREAGLHEDVLEELNYRIGESCRV